MARKNGEGRAVDRQRQPVRSGTSREPRAAPSRERRPARHDPSAAAQEYLLALRGMTGDGAHVSVAQVARRMGLASGGIAVEGALAKIERDCDRATRKW